MDNNLRALEKHLGRFAVLDTWPAPLPIPAEWQPLIGLADEAKAKHIIALWAKDYSAEFRVLLDVFQKRLRTVHLIELGGQPALLYVFKNPRGKYLTYVGHAPRASPPLPPNAAALPWPTGFLHFYEHLHNGWYEVESRALGLMPLEELFRLSEREWDVLEEITVNFSLDNVLAVYSNDAGGYLCWNFATPEPSGLVWWDDEAPDVVDFWDILDEWAAMGIEDY